MPSHCFLLLFLIFQLSANAQEIFNEDIVHEIRVQFLEKEFEEILTSNYSRGSNLGGYLYQMADILIDGIQVDSIGIRYKGKSSYVSAERKKSFKIDFNEFVKGTKFHGLKKINLHNSYADPSFLRDPLSYHLFRQMGILAPRSSFSKLYINGEYWGLYQLVEQIDDVFAPGELLKNTGWDALSTNTYRSSLSLKSGQNDVIWPAIRDFTRIIEKLEGDEFRDSIQSTFNVEDFIKILVVYIATNNYDSILDSGRNWYLHRSEKSNRFDWIPWDNNISFLAIFPSIKEDCLIVPDFEAKIYNDKSVQFYDFSTQFSHVGKKWNFGDGTESLENDPLHRYKRKGKYKVCLSVNVADYCEETICKEVNIRKPLDGCFSIKNKNLNRNHVKTINEIPDCCDDWSANCEAYYLSIDHSVNEYVFDFWASNSQSQLVQKIMSIPEFKSVYEKEMCRFLTTIFTPEKMNEFIDHKVKLISKSAMEDQNLLEGYNQYLISTGENNSSRNLRNIIEDRISELLGFELCF